MPAGEAAPLEVIEPQLALELLVGLLGAVALLDEADDLLLRHPAGERGEEVAGEVELALTGGVDDVAAALQMSIGLFIRQLRQMPAEGDLSLPEASALKRLDWSGPTSVTELAKAEQISVQSMGTTLGALERRESRGGHTRDDYPNPDPEFAQVNMVTRVRGGAVTVTAEALPVMPDDLKELFEEAH